MPVVTSSARKTKQKPLDDGSTYVGSFLSIFIFLKISWNLHVDLPRKSIQKMHHHNQHHSSLMLCNSLLYSPCTVVLLSSKFPLLVGVVLCITWSFRLLLFTVVVTASLSLDLTLETRISNSCCCCCCCCCCCSWGFISGAADDDAGDEDTTGDLDGLVLGELDTTTWRVAAVLLSWLLLLLMLLFIGNDGGWCGGWWWLP